MVNFKPIFLITGILLLILSVAMAVPAIADIYYENDDWKSFLASAFFTCFVGGALVLSNQGKTNNFTIKQTFVLTTLSWLALVVFSSLPFVFAKLNMSFTDAFFESMSGLTTTGATVMTGLDYAPPGILLWRSILQWLGGIGIIVLAMAVLPMLKIGGMQLFRTESSDKSEKILPRARQISGMIGGIYVVLTFICFIALWFGGMETFDAICHALTTISTGGFSTHDKSIGFYDSQTIETIMIIFILISSVPFVLYIQVMHGRYKALWRDSQVQWFIAILLVCVTVSTFWLSYHNGLPTDQALRLAAFNVTSIMTTSGFATADYYLWGGFMVTLIFLISVMGGCTGSTTGGIKIFRYQVLYETAKSQISRLIQPHGIFPPQFNNKPISDVVTSSVMSFFILFALSFTLLAILLSLTGLDYITSMSGAAAAVANVGPGLGSVIGPAGNYASLTDVAKWLLAGGMLVGRLEIFTVLVLFSSYFWRD